jgi:hypothetical protein
MEVVDDESAGVSRAEGDPPAVPGDGPDAFAGLQKARGRVSRIYAPATRSLLRVRRIAELVGDRLVGLREAHPPQQIFHPESGAVVVLGEQVYLVEVIFGSVGGTCPSHAGSQETVRMFCYGGVHWRRV